MEGNIEICHVEQGQEIVVDKLSPGSYLFSYTLVEGFPIQLTGIARGKVSLLVLPEQALNYARRANRSIRQEISKVESYIEANGVPKCDYTKYRKRRLKAMD